MEMPYRILVLGDFAAGYKHDEPSLTFGRARLEPFRVDGTTFLPRLKELTGRARLDFEDADPENLRLEAAWRGLRFLVSRVNLQKDIVIDILPCDGTDFADRLRRLARQERLDPTSPPIGLIVAAWTFAPADDGIALFSEAARAARDAGAPLVAGVDLDAMERFSANPEWAAFRAEESSEYLGLAANRFLLREEGAGAPVYGSPAIAVAVACGRSFVEHGWPTHLTGAVIENLPIHEVREGFIPTETFLSPERAAALGEKGLLPLVVAKNRDNARILAAPSAHADSGLSFRLATSRLHTVLNQALREVARPAEPAALEAAARKALKKAVPAAVPVITIAPAPDWFEGVSRLTVTVTAGPPVLTSPRDVTLDFIFGAEAPGKDVAS